MNVYPAVVSLSNTPLGEHPNSIPNLQMLGSLHYLILTLSCPVDVYADCLVPIVSPFSP